MFKKLIDKIKLFLLKRKLKRQYKIGSLVYQPETLMYYIVEAYVDDLVMLIDEYRMAVPVQLNKLKDNYTVAKHVFGTDHRIEYKVKDVDTINYTVEIEDRGYVTLQDLNEGEI